MVLQKVIDTVENLMDEKMKKPFRVGANFIVVWVYGLLKLIAMYYIMAWVYSKKGFDLTVILLLVVIVNLQIVKLRLGVKKK